MKINTKCKNIFTYCLSFLFFVAVQVTSVYASPLFFIISATYKTLIDDFAKSNNNGSAFVCSFSVDPSEDTKNQLFTFKESSTVPLNTQICLAKDIKINNEMHELVSSSIYTQDKNYNSLRIYCETTYKWSKLQDSNYVYISEELAIEYFNLERNSTNVYNTIIDKTIDVVIDDTTYDFKVGGVYSSILNNAGWRSRSNYINKILGDTLYINENLLLSIYENAVYLSTKDTVDSGKDFQEITNILNRNEKNNLITPKNDANNKILASLTMATNSINNYKKWLVLALYILAIIMEITFESIFAKNVLLKKKKAGVAIMCLTRFGASLSISFIFKSKIMKSVGLVAYGANKASLTLISLLTALSIIIILISNRKIIFNKEEFRKEYQETSGVIDCEQLKKRFTFFKKKSKK